MKFSCPRQCGWFVTSGDLSILRTSLSYSCWLFFMGRKLRFFSQFNCLDFCRLLLWGLGLLCIFRWFIMLLGRQHFHDDAFQNKKHVPSPRLICFWRKKIIYRQFYWFSFYHLFSLVNAYISFINKYFPFSDTYVTYFNLRLHYLRMLKSHRAQYTFILYKS